MLEPSPYPLPCILALDTANEVIAVGVGEACADGDIHIIASLELPAHRASNTKLLECVDDALAEAGVSKGDIGCVACGRGPGSFTGVRIAMATAKGIAQALGVSLVGVSTLDAIAWAAWQAGERGQLLVAADAMRHEVYPVRYALGDAGIERLESDRVVKAEDAAAELADGGDLLIAGDALFKYADLFASKGRFADEALWTPRGAGLLLALQDVWRSIGADIFDASIYDPAFALPVYTRLSDAEENERTRLASQEAKDLVSGVQGAGITYQPLERRYVPAVALMERATMGTDAWSEALLEDELARKDRSWWIALQDGELIGYAGGLVACGELQILKVAVSPDCRRKGIARELVARVAADARNLGAETATLEVRASNKGAQAFYGALGLEDQGTRPGYYSDREDAVIMSGALPHGAGDIAGMTLQVDGAAESAQAGPVAGDVFADVPRPLIFAIESSCDETAAAIIDGSGKLIADVVASQIDFHARFGGVVPEIASRKHIEAICGVCSECLEAAAERLGCATLGWQDMDAVAATYAPGLVGALVVGVAFAKGAAWGAGKPFIGVNHLEGHLYANKLADEAMEPPAVASLVSGGNTMLVHVKAWGDYEVLGTTIDDAVGEAFDKVAKALGLGYPGGPAISRMAKDGDPDAIAFPRAMLHSGDYRFSLSGLKTAVITHINQKRASGREPNIPDICASFQQAVIDVQVAKARTALRETGAPLFCLGGGVAANAELRRAYEAMCAEEGVRLLMPPLRSCGDNAGMIALVALDRYRAGRFFDLSADAYAHADLAEPY